MGNDRKLIKYKDIYDDIYVGYHYNKVNDDNGLHLRQAQDLFINISENKVVEIKLRLYKKGSKNGIEIII